MRKNTGYPSTGLFRFFVCPWHFACSKPSHRPSSIDYSIAFLREEGGAQLRDARSLRYFEAFTLYNLTRHFYKHFSFAARAPSVAYGTSSLPKGAFHKNTSCLYSLFAFFSPVNLYRTTRSVGRLIAWFSLTKRERTDKPYALF